MGELAIRVCPRFSYCGKHREKIILTTKKGINKMFEKNDNLYRFSIIIGLMISDEEVVYIERIGKTFGVKLTANLGVGSRRPIHANAIGKVILAFLPEGDQRRILDHWYSANYSNGVFCSEDDLIEQLRNIRVHGYSANKSLIIPGYLSPCRTHPEPPVPARGGD
jgi:hypothetical protein